MFQPAKSNEIFLKVGTPNLYERNINNSKSMYCVCSEYNGLVRNEYLTVEININSMHISKCENHKIEKHVVFLISKIGTTALISAK